MSFKFPFEYAYIEGLGRLFYPIISVELNTIEDWKELEFLVDTGADVTTVPIELLSILGFQKSQLTRSTTLGVGGIVVKTWELKLPIRIGGRELVISASAVETKNDSMPLLLGRKDIFESRFSLLLDSKRKVTVISENS